MNIQDPSNLMTKLISSLDLDDFEDMPTGKLVLLNPKTKEPTSSHLVLASPEHEIRRRLDMKRTREMRAQFQATGKMPTSDPIDEIEEETDYLVAATLSWNLTQNGKPVEFSAATARILYTDPKKKWFRDQALAGLAKSEIFIKTSAKA
jgi:hypothetical protein